VTPKQGLDFVARHGVVLQAARGPVPNLVERITGSPISGSWWGHSKGHEIFETLEAISESRDVLVCKLVDGKITYVHRRVWPALVKLASRFPRKNLAKVWNEHTKIGAHRARSLPFPKWVPEATKRAAGRLSIAEAERELAPVLGGNEVSRSRIRSRVKPRPPSRSAAGER
jgi:hypothetical protein